MGYTKRHLENNREPEAHYNPLHEEHKRTLDADYQYEQYLQHPNYNVEITEFFDNMTDKEYIDRIQTSKL